MLTTSPPPAAAAPPADRLLSVRDTIALTSLSRTSLWRLTRTGHFPVPVRLSANRIAFREREVREWIVSRAPTRPPAPPLP